MRKQTSNTRYPFTRRTMDIEGPDCILRAVHPGQRMIIENRNAAPGANVILLLYPRQR